MRRGGAFVAATALSLSALAVGDDKAVIVAWETLANVSVTRQDNRYVPQFSPQILALDSRTVTLRGFMLPLEQGARQKHFLLSAQPPECAFCMPGTAEQFAEILARVPVKYVTDPVTLSGKFIVLRDESGGLLYRLTDAAIVEK